jgi:hypothetical protein
MHQSSNTCKKPKYVDILTKIVSNVKQTFLYNIQSKICINYANLQINLRINYNI